MQIPDELIQSLQQAKGFDERSFIEVHNSNEQVTSIRINPKKWPTNEGDCLLTSQPLSPSVTIHQKVPWTTHGYYLAERPSFTFDPLFHAGAYYVQEASSMFLEQVLRQTTDLSQPLRVLDLCAAPGGKSTLIQSLISDKSILVSNEVITSRASVLAENITKWGASNIIVTNNEPRIFQRLENYFDVIVIDAPCSGSGLFRKDPIAIEEWSAESPQLCSLRQQRILAEVLPALKSQGILIYSTCSYSEIEDEGIADWLMQEFGLEGLRLHLQKNWNIIESEGKIKGAFGYRFYPDKVKGEGFFIACFKKPGVAVEKVSRPKKMKVEKLSRREEAIISPWLNEKAGLLLWKLGNLIFGFPIAGEKDLLTMVDADFYIRKAGVAMGTIIGNALVPDHALALSSLVNQDVFAISLKKDEALQYLRKEEVKTTSPHKGWALVQYEGLNLGWIKILLHRSNNYYPKEWRILKRGNP